MQTGKKRTKNKHTNNKVHS